MTRTNFVTDQNADAPPVLSPQLMGAAASKLVAASIGDIAMVFSRSPAHKHYSLADIEWMILPAVFSAQFYVAEIAHTENGLHAPIAVATWAFVSEEVDRRIRETPGQRIRLRPDQWKCGDIAWIVDLAGNPRGIAKAVEWLRAGPFKERDAWLALPDGRGGARVETIACLASQVPESAA